MQQILVIDDNEPIRILLEAFLTGEGHMVLTAGDGKQGIQMFGAQPDLDLVITDIRMPRVSGYDLAKHIRESNRPETPIIAITGWETDEFQEEIFDALLKKPFKLEALRQAIASVC